MGDGFSHGSGARGGGKSEGWHPSHDPSMTPHSIACLTPGGLTPGASSRMITGKPELSITRDSAIRDEQFLELAASVKHGGLRSSGRLRWRVRQINSRRFGCLPCITLPLCLLVLPSTLPDVGLAQAKVAKRRGV